VKGLHLVVEDMAASRSVLIERHRRKRHRGHGWSSLFVFQRSRRKHVGPPAVAGRLPGLAVEVRSAPGRGNPVYVVVEVVGGGVCPGTTVVRGTLVT
jgi:hypothetical protein